MWFFVLGSVLSIFGLLYIFFTWNFNYWTIRGVPGPKPLPLFGSFKGSFLQKINNVYEVDEIYKEYRGKSPYVGVFQSRKPQIVPINSELVKNIFGKDFKNFQANDIGELIDKETDPIFGRNPFLLKGEEWKDKRAEITPAFTASRIKSMFPIIEDVCKKMTIYIQKQIGNSDNEMEAKELSSKYTIDVVSNCIYGVDSKAFTNDHSEIREMGLSIFKPDMKLVVYFTVLTVFPFLKHLYRMPFVSKKVEIFFVNLMKNAIELRNRSNADHYDYLNYLMELRRKKNISELDMAAHTITFFLDGFETSSAAISHILYTLAKNKHCQKKLRNEIRSVGEISFDNINDFSYLDQVFNETLRLYPPVGVLTKLCTSPIEISDYKDKKLTVEKNVVAILPLWSIHRDPEYYANPEQFDPERFSADNGGVKQYKERGQFFPFGDGPRQCLGMRFATTQTKSAIVEIVKNFDISLSPKMQEPYVLDPKVFTSQPVGGIWIKLKKLTA